MNDLEQAKKEMEADSEKQLTQLKDERNRSIKDLEAKLSQQSEKIQDLDRNLAQANMTIDSKTQSEAKLRQQIVDTAENQKVSAT